MYTISGLVLNDCGNCVTVTWPASGQNRLLALNYVRAGEEQMVCAAHEAWGVHFQTLFSQLPPLPKPQPQKSDQSDAHLHSSSKDRGCTEEVLGAEGEGEAAHTCSVQAPDTCATAGLAASVTSPTAVASAAVPQCSLHDAVLQPSAAELQPSKQIYADGGVAKTSPQHSGSLVAAAAEEGPLENTRRLTVRINALQLLVVPYIGQEPDLLVQVEHFVFIMAAGVLPCLHCVLCHSGLIVLVSD